MKGIVKQTIQAESVGNSRPDDVPAVRPFFSFRPATDVIETARRRRADCVFIGAEEIGFIERVFCGDFVASVALRAECSVEVVRGPVRRGAEISGGAAGACQKDPLPVAS